MATGFRNLIFRALLGNGERRRNSAAFPNRTRKQGLLFLAFVMTVSTATPQTPSSVPRTTQTLVPPMAKRVPKEIVTHGDKRLDDYFWLREKTNVEVIAYLEAENAYGDAVTRPQQPFRERLYGEMLGHLQETDTSAPVRRGEFFYYRRTEKGKNNLLPQARQP
jgi:oligopeptidase B